MSFDICEQIWRVLDTHHRHLLLMMSDCPLTIHYKKGEYIWIGDFVDRGSGDFVSRGSFCCFWSYGALDCI